MKKTGKNGRPSEFLEEAEEILTSLGKDLLKLERAFKSGTIKPALVNSIFRSAHTLKGLSGIFDIDDMSLLCHELEDQLDAVRLGRVTLTDDLIDSVMQAHALLEKMASSGSDVDYSSELTIVVASLQKNAVNKKTVIDELKLNKKLPKSLTEYEENRLVENLRDGRKIFTVDVMLPVTSFDKEYELLSDLIDSIGELIATLPGKARGGEPTDCLPLELLIGSATEEEALKKTINESFRCSVSLLFSISSAGMDASGKTGEGQLIHPHPRDHETLRSPINTVRVDIAKLDSVMNIIGDFGLMKSTLSRVAREVKLDHPYSAFAIELSRLERHMERKFNELRDSLLDIRMVKVGQLFGRYETLLSRLSRKTKKEIRMVTEGVDTEFDKLMVEELTDPIMHIIRNIVDHAIELPGEREELGKDRVGTITLRASQKGNRVVLEVSDDGAGIDIESVKRKAVSMQLVTEEYVENLSDTAALDLLFLPGLTTRRSAGEVSGRGVGLDVVKENIARLSGVIEVVTRKGAGTSFILTIPITLAIIPVIIVEDSGEKYALPLNNVTEVITVSPGDVIIEEESEVIRAAGRTIPYIRLSTFMTERPGRVSPLLHGIIAGSAEHRLCIASERIIEQIDVVIKPLSNVIKVPGIAGAADLGIGGDEGTVLVLDVGGIAEASARDKKGLYPEILNIGQAMAEEPHS